MFFDNLSSTKIVFLNNILHFAVQIVGFFKSGKIFRPRNFSVSSTCIMMCGIPIPQIHEIHRNINCVFSLNVTEVGREVHVR